MPKKFSETEREFIKKRLKEEALKCLTTFGVKKTTVDELVKRVNIPKGTFYLFYETKELCLFDAINDLHMKIHERFLKQFSEYSGKTLTCEDLTELLFQLYQQIDDTGLMQVIVNGELEYLMRKLPEEAVREHTQYDDFSVKELFSYLNLEEADVEAYSGAFRAIFLTILFKREIGEPVYERVMKLMIRGLVMQIIEEKSSKGEIRND